MAPESPHLHRNDFCAAEVDLNDPYVKLSIPMFILHKIICRNLISAASHAKSLGTSDFEAYLSYSGYVLHDLSARLSSVNEIWYPVLAQHDPRFRDLIESHKPLLTDVNLLRQFLQTLQPCPDNSIIDLVANRLIKIQERVSPLFHLAEQLAIEKKGQTPLATVQELITKQLERRKELEAMYGKVWMTFYEVSSLSPEEKHVYPQIPDHLLERLMMSGKLLFRK
ncbi:hypothetical protein BJY04DRAFT_221759 [Aspergillus karnatakaensis]|uniref:xanthocillin biosynthesis cluster protein xanF n=1 Tax=Aspergillus karnatakaensis TaxID=1810916 RepID=UPI003CCD400B